MFVGMEKEPNEVVAWMNGRGRNAVLVLAGIILVGIVGSLIAGLF